MENGNFLLKNVIQKFWSVKFFSAPPNSAPGLRLWMMMMIATSISQMIDRRNMILKKHLDPSLEYMKNTKRYSQLQ